MHLVDTTVFYSPTSGGVRRYLTAKHDWLRAHTTHRHSLLVPGDRDQLVPGGISTLSGWHVPGTFTYRLPLAPRKWARMLAQLEPDLIEVGDAFHPAWCAAAVAQARNIPLVAFFHSNLPQILGRRMGGFVRRRTENYIRWLYQRVDVVLTPSQRTRDYLADIGVPHTALQPLGVDSEMFSPQRRVLNLRQTLGLSAETRLLVYAGRFSGEKNIDVLMQAMARLGRPYHLLLIGGGRDATPARNVTVMPFRRAGIELAEWLASCDALVHAGSNETFGLVLLEAMACGLPVIGVDSGAVPEFVDSQVGQLARPRDVESMAAAISDLYQRDLRALGAAARRRVLEHYTWTQAFNQLLQTYASLGVAIDSPTFAPPMVA
jgi:alpha-1,6-mannosyltransferase